MEKEKLEKQRLEKQRLEKLTLEDLESEYPKFDEFPCPEIPHTESPAVSQTPESEQDAPIDLRELRKDVPVPEVGPESCVVICPSCRATVQTTVEYEASCKTHLVCLFLCLIGMWPCCLVPYCVESCLNKEHLCPECGDLIGIYKW